MFMSIDSILRQKGADVATIAPEASVKRATSWLHAKNVGSGSKHTSRSGSSIPVFAQEQTLIGHITSALCHQRKS